MYHVVIFNQGLTSTVINYYVTVITANHFSHITYSISPAVIDPDKNIVGISIAK